VQLHFLHNFWIPWHYGLWNYTSITEARASVLTRERNYWSPQFLAVTISTHRKQSKMSNTPPAPKHMMTKATTAWSLFRKSYLNSRSCKSWRLTACVAELRYRVCLISSTPVLMQRLSEEKPPRVFCGLSAAQRKRWFLKYPLSTNANTTEWDMNAEAVTPQQIWLYSSRTKPGTFRCYWINRWKTNTNQENFTK